MVFHRSFLSKLTATLGLFGLLLLLPGCPLSPDEDSGGPKEDTLVIPVEALIRTGREERVVLALGDGQFASRQVSAGMESGGWIEIIQGLAAGDAVVTSGQFLIDSEASLKASLQRMGSPADTGRDNQP